MQLSSFSSTYLQSFQEAVDSRFRLNRSNLPIEPVQQCQQYFCEVKCGKAINPDEDMIIKLQGGSTFTDKSSGLENLNNLYTHFIQNVLNNI